MRATLRVLQRVPLIKFVGGPHTAAHTPATIHPCAPAGLRPGSAGSSAASSGAAVAFQSRNNLSKRFRYVPLDEIEIEDVLTGGADVLIK
ncbi:hypothetical protein PICMEDRAFT_15799 [Pichia membranifaciens NRRL Y-2026]|uniref:Uncharacterized protein n=1 Tax=Pichia membranifaciens NRRL Y-2026 TaxID=763406 RepID=A0A1E3NP94_9ASCO|nr:hypothetical protein PICMEDRAFT_15799 [Pichia membranifaciens NRRL Y-2026]ODQ47930.1 hypothetical protein PICMEDRAFT_15799 [Pichia membranifaciens NRRL Y-2026]